MDILDSLIFHLSTDERSDFRSFHQRLKKSENELRLFNLLLLDPPLKPREIAAQIYQPVNMNAYHSLRKRLLNQLLSFMVMHATRNDNLESGSVMEMVSMAHILINRKAIKVAVHFLQKAEQTALRNRQFELLETIYNLMVSKSDILNLDAEPIIQRWNENSRKYDNYRKLKMAHAMIREELSTAKIQGIPIKPESILDSVYKSINLTRAEVNNPAFLHTVASMARSAFASTKGYQKLEPFILRLYKSLHRANAFGKSDIFYEISFLYMIAHTLYRNRKFDEAEEWLESIAVKLPEKQLKTLELYSKIISLRAAIACYQGKNAYAVEYMEKALQSNLKLPDLNEKLNMQLNLAVYYFIEEKFKKADKTLASISHTNSWLEENMGKEWRFKKNMIELIVQYELGNIETARTKLKKMKRYFAKFLDHPSYRNASIFMNFIEEMIDEPEIVKSAEFHKKVDLAGNNWGEMKYDIQAITFFSWLSSKMQQRSYYELLLDEINPGCTIK